MDYKKLHKDTIAKLQEMVNSGKITVKTACNICADFVPESEDEEIRKAIIAIISNYVDNSNTFKPKMIAWLEKQGSQNNTEDEDLLYRFCFYSYKDESNILYLSGLYVNGECRNKGIGTKILEVADEVAKNLNCYAIRLKTEIGSNAERLYRRNGYNTFKREGNNVWLEKQGEHKIFRDSIQVGDEVTRNSDGVIVNLSQLKRVAKKSEQKLPIEKLPSEMKTIRESLGFTTQEECDEYNEIVTNLIMGDDDKGERKTALSEEDEKMVANLVDYFKVDDALQYTEKQVVDWLNAHHFDYRGMIEKGLAIEAPDGMYQ